MSVHLRFLNTLLLCAILISPFAIAGCATHRYRAYDPYFSDYHVWDRNEVVFYNRWEVETHRGHREFRERNREEQRDYWSWRHSHR
jgi:hypothetical protein